MSYNKFISEYPAYLNRIREAKDNKSHHDQLRNIFISFLNRSFGIEHEDFELEKGISAIKIRGYIDALFQDIIFEFKRNLDKERDEGKREITDYIKSLPGGTYFGILTDGLIFEAYVLKEAVLEKTDDIILKPEIVEDAFSWFDRFLFSEKELAPTSTDMIKRFGPLSPVFLSSYEKMRGMFEKCQKDASVQIKFNEWDKLLAKVYGSSITDAELFLRHTYLSTLVKLIAFLRLSQEKPKKHDDYFSILNGDAFNRIGLQNLAEQDFFTWLLSHPLLDDTYHLLKGFVDHLAVYDLTRINEDLLKELYQQLVDPQTRHDLGEYYTPDWLAEFTLREAGWDKSKKKSLLDPACGSGTFLFIAINLLREQGITGPELVKKAIEDVVGVDVHPLAVTISKINYVLALAPDLQGYHEKISIPVYMADSLIKKEKLSFGEESISVAVSKDEKFSIPPDMPSHPEKLDKIIDDMKTYATMSGEDAINGFKSNVKKYGYTDETQIWQLTQNLRLMMKLVKEGRDTIWSFILKNYYRPIFLCEKSFDLVVGNPPWLAYHDVQDPDYQTKIKQLTLSYQLLATKDVRLFTHMDLSTLFFAYCLYTYIRDDATIAFVMPRSVITGAKQHNNFQQIITGKMSSFWLAELKKLIDLEKVVVTTTRTKQIFNVPSCVIIARKRKLTDTSDFMSVNKLEISGTLNKKNISWQEAKSSLTISKLKVSSKNLFSYESKGSYYLDHFREGATLVPRSFWFIHSAGGKGLGIINRLKPYIETDPEIVKDAKEPWKGIVIKGEVEANFIHSTLLSKHLLPFGYTQLNSIVLPLEISDMGLLMLNSQSALSHGYTGLSEWLIKVEDIWNIRKKESIKENPGQWLNYGGKLVTQYLQKDEYLVIYGRAGTNLTSMVVLPHGIHNENRSQSINNCFWVDYTLYYLRTKSEQEAYYLCAFINSDTVNRAIKPHQTKGTFGERDISRRPFEYNPIPQFNPSDKRHILLAKLSQKCHAKVKTMELQGKSIGLLRHKVREALKAELDTIDDLVKSILG